MTGYADLVKRLRSQAFERYDEGEHDCVEGWAADAIEALMAEVAVCHENINTKADWIDDTINDMASRDEQLDTAIRAAVKAALDLVERPTLPSATT